MTENKEMFPYFFSLFELSKKEILKLIECLKEEEKALLYKKYGENLSRTYYIETITKEEKKSLFAIIRKLHRMEEKYKTGEYVIEGILDEFPEGVTLEQIKLSIKDNSSKYIKVIYNYFGDELTKKILVPKTKSKKILSKEIVRRLIRKIYNIQKIHSKFCTFISQFESERKPNETDEELLKRTKQEFYNLESDELELLYKKYNEDLQNTVNNKQFTRDENQKILLKIIPKLKYYMRKTSRGVIYCEPLKDFFSELTPFNEVLEEIETLPEYEQELLQEKYLSDYKGVTPIYALPKEKNHKIKRIIEKIQKRILKRQNTLSGIERKTLYKIRHLLQTEEFKQLEKSIYGFNYGAAIMLETYMNNEITLEQISKLTSVPEILIIDLSKLYLLNQKRLLISENEKINIKELI